MTIRSALDCVTWIVYVQEKLLQPSISCVFATLFPNDITKRTVWVGDNGLSIKSIVHIIRVGLQSEKKKQNKTMTRDVFFLPLALYIFYTLLPRNMSLYQAKWLYSIKDEYGKKKNNG